MKDHQEHEEQAKKRMKESYLASYKYTIRTQLLKCYSEFKTSCIFVKLLKKFIETSVSSLKILCLLHVNAVRDIPISKSTSNFE